MKDNYKIILNAYKHWAELSQIQSEGANPVSIVKANTKLYAKLAKDLNCSIYLASDIMFAMNWAYSEGGYIQCLEGSKEVSNYKTEEE